MIRRCKVEATTKMSLAELPSVALLAMTFSDERFLVDDVSMTCCQRLVVNDSSIRLLSTFNDLSITCA